MTTTTKPGCLGVFLRLFRAPASPPPPAPPVSTHIIEPKGTSVQVTPVQEPAPRPAPDLTAIRLNPRFMTTSESQFYGILNQAVAGRYLVFPKVGLGDVFYVPTPDLDVKWSTRGRFSQKHVDFLLCDAASLRPVLGIELDDRGHTRPERQARDEVKNEVFAAAGLPLLRLPVYPVLRPADLRQQIEAKIAGTPPPAPPQTPLCPIHQVPMQPHVAKKGRFAGKSFYSCPKYPECREIVPIDR